MAKPINGTEVNERLDQGINDSTSDGAWAKKLLVAPSACSATLAVRGVDRNGRIVLELGCMSGLTSRIRTDGIYYGFRLEMKGLFCRSRINREVGQNFPIVRIKLGIGLHERKLNNVLQHLEHEFASIPTCT